MLCYFMYFMWYFVGLRCTIICQLSLTLRLSLLFLPIGVLPDALWYPIYAFLLYRQSAFYILHNNTHLLTLLLAPRHCLYLLRRTPKHTAITFVPPLPKHHLYLNTKLTALTFSKKHVNSKNIRIRIWWGEYRPSNTTKVCMWPMCAWKAWELWACLLSMSAVEGGLE